MSVNVGLIRMPNENETKESKILEESSRRKGAEKMQSQCFFLRLAIDSINNNHVVQHIKIHPIGEEQID